MAVINNSIASIKCGLVGGFVATLVSSAILQMKTATGELSEVHVIKAWSTVLGDPTHLSLGWLAYLVIGIFVGGIAFALLSSRLPTRVGAERILITCAD